MNNTSLSFIFLFLALFQLMDSFGQKPIIDSLKSELSNYALKDIGKADLLIDIADAYFRTELDSAGIYLKKAEKLCVELAYTEGKANVYRLLARLENIRSNYVMSLEYLEQSLANYRLIDDKEGIARVYIGIGINQYDLSKYKEAMTAYQHATEIYQSLGNKRGIATCQINIALVYDELGEYSKAISKYQHALELSNEISDEEGVAYVNTNLGGVYQIQGNYPMALLCFYKALNYREAVDDYIGLTYTLHSLGEVNFAMQKYDKALTFFKRSLEYAVQTGDKNNIVFNNSDIGDIYLIERDYETALEYYISSLDICKEINNLKQIATVQNKVGNVQLSLKNPQLARTYFTKAMQVSQQTSNQQILADSYLGIAETYIYNKQYSKAISYIQQGRQIADDLGLLPIQQKAVEFLHTIYKSEGDFEKALVYHEKYKLLSDSIFNEATIEKITALEYKYKYEKELAQAADRELKLAQTVQTTALNLEKSQRNLFIGIISFLLVSLVFTGSIFFLKLRHAKAKNQNIIIEQKLLRSQMTPHFVFNSLSVLQGMILNKEDKKSISYLSKFSKLLRLTLENSRNKIVQLSKELNAVTNYLELQKLEADGDYNFIISLDDTINADLLEIPPMLIQPFVENAIEHGFKNQNGDKQINIDLKFVAEKLVCIITDNGIGIDSQKEIERQDKQSLATTITSERLKMLSVDFKMEGTVTIEDRSKYNEQGTIVTLVIPYKSNKL